MGHSLGHGLPRLLLHLDVVELPEVAEPLDELGGDAAGELDRPRERGFESATHNG